MEAGVQYDQSVTSHLASMAAMLDKPSQLVKKPSFVEKRQRPRTGNKKVISASNAAKKQAQMSLFPGETANMAPSRNGLASVYPNL